MKSTARATPGNTTFLKKNQLKNSRNLKPTSKNLKNRKNPWRKNLKRNLKRNLKKNRLPERP